MDKDKEHREKEAWEEQEAAFFRKVDVPLGEDKEAIWELFSEEIDKKEPTKVRSIWMKSMVAAAIIVIISSIAFCKNHTITINSQNGEHLAHELPDGSTIELNAASSIVYAPYWWLYDRAVELKGEAYFEVKKGSSFVVYSSKGKTEVLGTSFNIYARDDEYRVLCTEGKVQVFSKPYEAKLSFSLLPTEMANIDRKGRLFKRVIRSEEKITSWRKNRFYFDDTPLIEVVKEIERQYDVRLDLPESLDERLTGIFNIKKSIEETLEVICMILDLKFIQTSKKSYRIERQ